MSQEIVINGAISESDEVAQNPDSRLMARLRSGEDGAMNELVHRFGPRLHRLVGRLTGWSAESDDILQEVFLTAWRKAAGFHGAGSLEGWLRKLAVNRCRNHHRARAAFQRLLDRAAGRTRRHDVIQSPHDVANLGDLHAALGRLRPTDRAVLVLYYLEELSGEEVAEALGVRIDAVHVRLHRARLRLRDLLTAEDATDG